MLIHEPAHRCGPKTKLGPLSRTNAKKGLLAVGACHGSGAAVTTVAPSAAFDGGGRLTT